MSEEKVDILISYIEEMKAIEGEYAIWLGALMTIETWYLHKREIKSMWVAYFRCGWEPEEIDYEKVAALRYHYKRQLDELNRPLTIYGINLEDGDDIPF